MRSLSVIISLLLPILLMGQNFPEPMSPPRLVNDYSGILTERERSLLESKLLNYEDTTSNQFAIVVVKSTEGYEIGQYTIELGERWGIGRQGKDNGLLIVVAIEDRDIFISTGYGLEGAIPDVAVRRIIDNYIVPNFRSENYFEGLDEATSILIGLAEGEFAADEIAARDNSGGGIGLLIFIALMFLLPYYFGSRRAARRHFGSSSPSFWMIMALMMSGRGSSGSAGRSFNDFTGGGGGFGGFGGGSFGGGGAGGSW